MTDTRTPRTTSGTGQVSIERVAGHIGAVVSGVDLAADLDSATVVSIRDAWLEHQVLFFRGQYGLDHAGQVAFATRFGQPIRRARPQEGGELDAFPQIWTISPEADVKIFGFDHEQHYRSRQTTGIGGWHTDLSTSVNPPMASILRAEVVPSYGGDTVWTNLEAAYAGLPRELRGFVDWLEAVHEFFAAYDMDPNHSRDRTILEQSGAPQVAIHPVVRVHPETQRRSLFINPARVKRILDLSPCESRHVLGLLFQEVTRPEYTVRWSWKPDDVVFWDNRSTAHLGIGDYAHTGELRRLHRVSLLGDEARGPNGQTSHAVTGQVLTAVDAPTSTADRGLPSRYHRPAPRSQL